MTTYHEINEETARRAKEMNSFSDYIPGSATADYRAMVDSAAALAERCKAGKSAADAAKIDRLLNTYARRLADNLNAENRNNAACPSVLVCGPSNFPVRKKQRQNDRAFALYHEYNDIAQLLEKMKSIGRGGIQADDPAAVQKLTQKLEQLEQAQQAMKDANAEARRTGQPAEVPEAIRSTVQHVALASKGPFPAWALSNNSAEIRRLRARIETLRQAKAAPAAAQEVKPGVTLEEDPQTMRLRLVFAGKPDPETRALLKSEGFRWAPSAGAWQRQLTDNARRAARRILSQL